MEIIVFCVEKSSYQETKGSKTRVKTLLHDLCEREKKSNPNEVSIYPIHIRAQFSKAGTISAAKPSTHNSLYLSSPFSSQALRVNSKFIFTTRLNQVSPAIILSIHSHLRVCIFFTLAREINIYGRTSLDSSSLARKWCACYSDEKFVKQEINF